MKKNILFLVITICLIYCKDYRIEITSLTLNGVIQEPVYVYFTDINSKAMSDILKDSSKVEFNFQMYDWCDICGEKVCCSKQFLVQLNDIQTYIHGGYVVEAGYLFLYKPNSDNIFLEITLLETYLDTSSSGALKIGKVKNLEDLHRLFNKTKTANNGSDIRGGIQAQSYLEIIPFTINLAINNCFGQSKCPNEYEIGVIIDDEFYGLNCLDSCLWKAQILTTSDIFNFKTLHYTSFSSDVKPIVKQFNISETLNDGECEFRKETNETFALICDFNTTQ